MDSQMLTTFINEKLKEKNIFYSLSLWETNSKNISS